MRYTSFCMILMFAAAAMSAKPTKKLYDNSIGPGTHLTLSSDTIYTLEEKMFCESTSVLTIRPGTWIEGQAGSGDGAKALIICRGARIYANGTVDSPIVFTSIYDDPSDPQALNSLDKGLWGGVVMLGCAVTNEGVDYIEGIKEGDPRSFFGGSNDDDTSGVLRYVSIRHAGTILSPNNELNGLSLAAIGRGTVVEHVEIFASADDGVELWGGAVGLKWFVSAFSDDDCFDYDQGWRGRGQFWFSVQDSVTAGVSANWVGEFDGDDTPGATPWAEPTISNWTAIGGGIKANPLNNGIILRENAGGHIHNSIITNVKTNLGLVIASSCFAVGAIDPAHACGSNTETSQRRFYDGRLSLKNNIWYGIPMGTPSAMDSIVFWQNSNTLDASAYAHDPILNDSMAAWNNSFADPMLRGIAYTIGKNKLDPRLALGSPAASGALPINDPFFTQVPYRGAFDSTAGADWMKGWTKLWQAGYLGELASLPVGAQTGRHWSVSGPCLHATSNVSSRELSISYTLPAASPCDLSLYSFDGRKIATLFNGKAGAGTQTWQVPVPRNASGAFLLRLQAGDLSATEAITIR